MEISMLLMTTLFSVLALILYVYSTKRARFIHLVNTLPGPMAYPLVGSILPFILAPRNKRWNVMLRRLHRYQPILRTWIGPFAVIHITIPEHAEVILNSTKHLDKAYGYDYLQPWLGTGLLTSTGAKWHSHRKMITPTFHFKILENFVEVFSEKSEILVNKLKNEVGNQGFDIYPYITRCALDIICETAMGTPVYAQENAHSPYVTAVYDMSELILKRATQPWLHFDSIFRLTKDGKRHEECLAVLHGFTNKVIRERKVNYINSKYKFHNGLEDETLGKKKRVAFLDMLLEASEDGVKLTDEEIREEVDTFMFEGHDTTSAGIGWTLFLLGLHSDVQNKVYEEIEGIFQGSNRPATMKDLNEMKYLERVIKESLRLYPSVPYIARSLKEDLDIGGYTVPAGTSVRVQIYFLHRNPDFFPNPEEFNPDNFLPERVAKRHPYAFIPFSAGPRNCIGQKFALLEEKTVLSYIIRHYKLQSLDSRENVNLIAELILRPENGIKLIITSREEKSMQA